MEKLWKAVLNMSPVFKVFQSWGCGQNNLRVSALVCEFHNVGECQSWQSQCSLPHWKCLWNHKLRMGSGEAFFFSFFIFSILGGCGRVWLFIPSVYLRSQQPRIYRFTVINDSHVSAWRPVWLLLRLDTQMQPYKVMLVVLSCQRVQTIYNLWQLTPWALVF